MATDPTTGLPTYGGTSTGTPSSAATVTPAATPTVTPAGPQDLGINANPPATETPSGPATIPETPAPTQDMPKMDPSVQDKIVPGGFTVPGQKAIAPHPYDEQQLVEALATELGIKTGPHPKNLETRVIQGLAKKYGVRVPLTSEGTGHQQGEVGQVRHDIANWFDSLMSNNPGVTKITHGKGGNLELQNVKQDAASTGGPSAANGGEEPDQSTKALQEMFDKVSEKLGIKNAEQDQQGFAQIAQKVGAPTETPGTAAAAGRPQTAADVYNAFNATAFDSSNKLTANGKLIAQDLVNAGVITQSQAGTPTAVAGGYASVITESVTNNTSITDTLTAQAAAAGKNVPAASDEWASYVQGVADEFGVALSQQQINDIATQYYKQALQEGGSVVDGPSAETDAIKNSVVALYDPTNSNDPAGVADQMFQGIKEAALAYGIPISDQQLGQYVKTALQGATVASMYTAKQSAIDQYTTVFQKQAQGLYPTIAPEIGAGMDVQTLIAPYNNITAAYTGKDAATLNAPGVDPTSPYYAFLQGGKDPTTGAPTMMSMDEWKKTLMQDPQYGFQNTQGAKNMASEFTSAVLNEFGLVNTGSSGNSFPTSGVITSANS